MLGRELREWAGRWESAEGFFAPLSLTCSPSPSHPSSCRLGARHHVVVGRRSRVLAGSRCVTG